jgi:flagellin
MLSILNNVASMAAQNQMSITNTNMQKTLEQLSSGQRINSGADDAAGLSIADGLNANVAALNQSSQNATTGVGELQVADGALAQVTSLLNRAVTLATEAANGGLTTDQHTALNNEFTSIKNEITSIGQTTTYNGNAIFGGAATSNANQVTTGVINDGTSTGASAGSAMMTGTLVVTVGGKTLPTFTATGGASGEALSSFVNDINTSSTTNGYGITASITSAGNLVLTDSQNRGNIAVATSSTLATAAAENSGSPEQTSEPFTNTNATAPTDYNTIQANGIVSPGTVVDGGGAGNLVLDVGGQKLSFATTTTTTVQGLMNQINTSGNGLLASISSAGKFTVTDLENRGDIAVDGSTTPLVASGLEGTGGSAFGNPTVSNTNSLNVFMSDSTGVGTSTISVALAQFDSGNLGVAGQGIANNDLTTTTDAATALTAVNQAISNVSALRGNIGAGVNQLQAATNVMSSQTQNLTTASSNITSADVSQTVADMTKYSILSQTGMAAMAQANQMQKGILTLLQG